MLKDIFFLCFKPSSFFNDRFLKRDSRSLRVMSFISTALGLSLGGFISFILTSYVLKNFNINPEYYNNILQNLDLNNNSFLQMLSLQKAYSLLLIFLSIIIAYMAPHILGGAIFAFLWLLIRDSERKIEFMPIFDCVNAALCSMLLYGLPLIGPLLALFSVGVNLSRALFLRMHIHGFLKAMGIIMALYLCFFVSAASLQLLAHPLVLKLNW
jgi:hypothetical protein